MKGTDKEHECKCKRSLGIPTEEGELIELHQCCAWDYIADPEFVVWSMDMYAHYENGYLPYEGGILDQPYWYLQAITHIGNLKAKIEAWEREKEAEQQKRESKRGR